MDGEHGRHPRCREEEEALANETICFRVDNGEFKNVNGMARSW
jgi:hypothetical protein